MLTTLLVTAIALGVPAAPKPAIQGRVTPPLKVRILRPDIFRLTPTPERVMVFRAAPDNEWVRSGLPKAMEALGIRGQLAPDKTATGLLSTQQDRRYAELYRGSGGTFCADLKRIWPIVGPDQIRQVNTRALSSEAAIATARRFVQQIGALPKEPVKPIYLPERIAFDTGDGRPRTAIVAAAVEFRRQVNGVPVVGPGGKLKVYLDMQGKPAGILRTMRVLRPYKELSIVPASKVLEQIREKPIRRQLLGGVQSVEISRFRLVYYEAGAHTQQRFLQPAYEVAGIAKGHVDHRTFTVPYIEIVPALVKEVEPMFPVGRTFKAVPRTGRPQVPQQGPDDEK